MPSSYAKAKLSKCIPFYLPPGELTHIKSLYPLFKNIIKSLRRIQADCMIINLRNSSNQL